MLRLFRQYYPIRNIFFVIGEGVTIYSSVLLAAVLLQGEQALHYDQWFYLKLLMITFVCQTSLYYNDLYDLKEKANFKDLSLRLMQSLGVSAIVLAFLNFAFPETVVASGIFHGRGGHRRPDDRFLALLLFVRAQPRPVQPAHHAAGLR